LSLRRPSFADAGPIAVVHVESWREAYGHLLPDGFFDEAHAHSRVTMWTSILTESRAEWSVQVAEDDRGIVGFAMAGPSLGPMAGPSLGPAEDVPRLRQLYSLYVLASHHGTGIGQALLDAVLNGGPATLWVARENPRAIAFYRRNGFEADGAERVDPAVRQLTGARMVR